MSIVLVILGVLLTGVLVVSMTLYFLQDKFILHPEKLPISYEFQFGGDFEEMNLIMPDGISQNGVLFRTKNSRGLIMLMHGHSGNADNWGTMAFKLNKLNYDLLVLDYRGFGKSEGKFSERDTYSDVKTWYQYITTIYPENNICLYGKGIGSTFASYLAHEFKPDKLILESPLYDLKFTALKYYPLFPFIKYLPTYKFDTASHIKKVKLPVYLIHGKLNKLVHYENSTKLLKLNKSHVDILIVEDGDHHNLITHPTYDQYLSQILSS